MFGDGRLSAEWLAGCRCERVCSDVAAQRLDLVTVAAVMPGDDRRDRGPVPVDEDAGFTHAGDANGRRVRGSGGGLQRRPERFDRSIEQLLAASSTPYDIVTQLRKELVLKIGARNQSPMSTVT